jgi:predicted Zn-dependent protease
MSRRSVGGYAFNAEVVRVRNASRAAREALRRIVEDKPGPQTLSLLIARAALALGEIEQATGEIENITRDLRETREKSLSV